MGSNFHGLVRGRTNLQSCPSNFYTCLHLISSLFTTRHHSTATQQTLVDPFILPFPFIYSNLKKACQLVKNKYIWQFMYIMLGHIKQFDLSNLQILNFQSKIIIDNISSFNFRVAYSNFHGPALSRDISVAFVSIYLFVLISKEILFKRFLYCKKCFTSTSFILCSTYLATHFKKNLQFLMLFRTKQI